MPTSNSDLMNTLPLERVVSGMALLYGAGILACGRTFSAEPTSYQWLVFPILANVLVAPAMLCFTLAAILCKRVRVLPGAIALAWIVLASAITWKLTMKIIIHAT